MKIAIAQMSSEIGLFESNAQKILEFSLKAFQDGAEVIVFPEMSLFGYPPYDLLENSFIVKKQEQVLRKLLKKTPMNLTIIFGAVVENKGAGKPFFNSALVIRNRKVIKRCNKTLLPNYDIFDESRFFEAGSLEENIISIRGKRVLITVCEDIWNMSESGPSTKYKTNPILGMRNKKIDLVLNLSASPFSFQKSKLREKVVASVAKFFRSPVVYVNSVGAQDELIFDGGSLVADSKGTIKVRLEEFSEQMKMIDLSDPGAPAKKSLQIESLKNALVLGIRDFVSKNGLKKVHLGLSGGIDSAVVACLAVEALGAKNVVAVGMPGPFSSPQSLILAKKLAQKLGIRFFEAEITSAFNKVSKDLDLTFAPEKQSLAHENLQARLRGMYLMYYSNLSNSMLLTTGNKSEYATGYSTIYGDMCGGLAPIGDLLKRQVYELAELMNEAVEVIPREIIERAPTAELRPNQTDQDSLPPYKDLDQAVEQIVVKNKLPKSKSELFLWKTLNQSEFKRWQAPPILRVSERSFGRGRRYPISKKI